MDYLLSPLTIEKGVGIKMLESYERLLGKKKPRIIDLLFHIPTRVIKRSENVSLQELQDNEMTIIKVIVDDIEFLKTKNKICKIRCYNNTGFITIIYYNYYPNFIESNYIKGKKIILGGVVKKNKFNNELTITHPDYVNKEIPTIEQIYPLTIGLTNRMIRNTIQTILSKMPEIKEWLPQNNNKYPSFKQSLLNLHNAKTNNDLIPDTPSFERLAIDELLSNQIALKIIKEKTKEEYKEKLQKFNNLTNHFYKNIPFKLTKDQEKVIKEIESDIYSNKRMLRLLQGDVGSGKTIVAFLTTLPYIENGLQVALMCPTSILATQHYNFFKKITKDKLNIDILLGNTKAKDKKNILQKLISGEINVIIGTHTLFQENIKFKNLGYVIIDEQHRFGVAQRLSLINR
jgi:ATP-dependent DNA helicase RecG